MDKERSIVCFGAGPVFKGGMSNYNTSLAKALEKAPNTKVHIVSWTQQYPSIVPREFEDKVSAKDFLEGTNISCKYITNYNKPKTWKKTAEYIQSLNPEIVIFQWSIAIQGLPIGSIIKRLKKISKAEIIIDLHFVVQKERSKIDQRFTKMGIARADSYIVHALKTYEELQLLFPQKKFELTYSGDRSKDSNKPTIIKLFHPIYDLYQPVADFDVAAFKKENNLNKHVFLYFGFIRKYKGLHNAIEAFAKVAAQRDDVSFLICGELFWNTLDAKKLSTRIKQGTFGVAKRLFLGSKENEKDYNPLQLITELGIEDKCAVFSEFIPNEDVHKYFQVADSVVLFYERATPSGIESLSYNFEIPVLTTNVGHFPETIQNGQNGYIVENNDIDSLASLMIKSIEEPIPSENVAKFKSNLSWNTYAEAILHK